MTLAWMAIPLSQGFFALLDDEEYGWLNQWKWCAKKDGYTYYAVRFTSRRKGKRRMIRMHREILGLPEGVEADHRNGCGLDNRRSNLRPATSQQNKFNQHLQHRKKYSRYKGVCWHKRNKKWQAGIQFNGKSKYLGQFYLERDAAKAYDRRAKELFGEFAKTNF